MINTKLTGSLIGYKVGNTIKRATGIARLIQDDLAIVKNEDDGKTKVIHQSAIKWING